METKQKGSSRINKEIVGSAYKNLKTLVGKYAKDNIPVLFTGEMGSGKERFADLYMASSPRKGKKMKTCCAGLPLDMLWSEVFGHIKGAFTDAIQNRKGRLQSCDNGILFLDELGDAPAEFQAAILRVAEGNSFSHLGSDEEEISVDTLVIAATNRPGNIREDLKQRFVILPVPPLQKRDIRTLARYFLKKPLKKTVWDDMMKKEYPGNVRELEKYCETLLAEQGEAIFTDHDSYSPEHPPFDYHRYRREIEVWERYIQPLVEKYKLGFKYKYFPLTSPDHGLGVDAIVFGNIPIPVGWTKVEAEQHDKEMLNQVTEHEIKRNPFFVPGMIKLIDFLNDGNENVPDSQVHLLPWFVKNLRSLFESESLPYLLATIQRFETRESVISKAYPELSHLLHLPLSKAMSRFELSYLEFYKKQFKSQQDAARYVGLKPNTFRSKLNRLRRELSNDKNE
jgi:DNA-binding NtrC family response regulator